MNYQQTPERNLADLFSEFKSEIYHFFSTRLEIFRAEYHESVRGWKTFVPLSIAALVLLSTAYVLFTLALIALIAVGFWNNPYHWFFSFLIVALVWTICGAFVAFFAKNTYRKQAMFPKRSIGVLRADKEWLEMEAKGHL